jgi:hypothetical protein
MGAVLEVKYFNSFLLKKINKIGGGHDMAAYNGSFGIPEAIGGYPRIQPVDYGTSLWAIEEARIRGGYNNTSTDYGARAYLVEDEPNSTTRGNALIYSGIFNSRTGINQSNVFSVGEDITKAVDPAKGTIQKLYAEDTNLIIFQENKVSRALIDKDAIYTAEGGGTITSSNTVIGQVVPYAGEYGISENPESFAVYGYRKYFADKRRNAVLRLSMDGIEEISRYGMRDYFRDEFSSIDEPGFKGRILGAFDVHNNQYVISTQRSLISPTVTYNTLSFDEDVKGWVSFFTFKPDQMFSIRNKFYSTKTRPSKSNVIWQHYSEDVNRCTFYENAYPNEGATTDATITFVFNPQISASKVFKTINYEGSNGWKISSIISDDTGEDQVNGSYSMYQDVGSMVHSYYGGEYIINPADGQAVERADYLSVFGNADPGYPRQHAGFNRKENKYSAVIINSSNHRSGEVLAGRNISGIKGYFLTVTAVTDGQTNDGGLKELFAVSSNYVESSY